MSIWRSTWPSSRRARHLQACRGCGFPYYDAGGCSGADDRVCAECTTCTDMEYESSPCEAGNDRVCVSCARDSECVNPTDNCRNVAKWWYQQNCYEDADGVGVVYGADQTESNVRIAKRQSREHWVFDVLPTVEDGYEQGSAAWI